MHLATHQSYLLLTLKVRGVSFEDFMMDLHSELGNKVGQIRSGKPSGGLKDDFLRSGGP